MKRILISLSIIGVIAALAVGGTMAYFFDTETSIGNTFTAGTLDLTVNGSNIAVTTVSVSGANVVPGGGGFGRIDLDNIGNVSGELDIATSNFSETAGAVGEFAGGTDLLGALKMVFWIDVDQNGAFNAGDLELLSNGTVLAHHSANNPTLEPVVATKYVNKTWNAVQTMTGGASDYFVISWDIPTNAGNIIQGDRMSFDVSFVLEQAARDN